MKNFIKLFLLSIIALCVMGCGNKNKIFDLKQEKLSFYKKHLGEYEMFSYHHSSSSATAESFADSDFSF
ncbi:MAG: hypothetical protein IJ937_04000, partial [Treponema sp.]|nr:hypothetical protein [Treponema sp.]